jgi:hypothetical protein
MAPFIAGDYVTWAGITNGPEILVYTLVAENVQQITDASKGDPVYVRVEDIIIGVNDGNTNVEVGTTKFTGYLSDASASVSVYRLDIDPCTGQENEVQVASGTLKAGDVRNKFDIRFRDTAKTALAREYRVKADKGQKTVSKDIDAGQYVSPITEVIWPEVNIPGTAFPQNPFDQFGQLKDGFVFNDQQWGQLNPWPGAPTPAKAKTCTGNELNTTPPTAPTGALPTADAGANIVGQTFGAITTITGSQTNTALTDKQVTFAWSTSATGITINNADKAVMNFVNPWGTTSVTRTFTLKICLVSDATKCSSKSVDVTTDKQQDTIKINSYQFASKGGGTITVQAESNNVLPANANGAALKIAFGTTTADMTQSASGSGVYTFSRTGVGKQPASIKVTSAHNTNGVSTSALVKRGLLSMRFMRN